jgi:uncharacterized membrane protein YdjX (TVP38/TMEM64 family)
LSGSWGPFLGPGRPRGRGNLEGVKKYARQIILLFVVMAIIVGIRFFGVGHYLTLENLKEHREVLEQAVAGHYPVSILVYVLLYTISTAFSVPGAAVLSLAGGFLFGTIIGAVCANVGATAGATLAFIFARYIVGDWFQKRYGTQLERFNGEFIENGYLYLLTVRFMPAFPFFLINILSGLTKIPVRTFVWTTSAGIIPGSLVYTFAGSQLGTIGSLGDLFRGRILIAFLLLAGLTLIPLIVKKVWSKPGRSR